MKMKLDADQMKAVKHFEEPALVVAGPGSGKTTIIKERILHLIREHKVNPEQILAIAFTNAAVEEMKKRPSSEPALNQSEPTICTLHLFGKDLLTNHYERLEFKFSKEPDIWDANDIEQIIYEEKTRLNTKNGDRFVCIYKFEGKTTGRCYIGQTIDLERREREHRVHSSNRELREALQKGDEHFNCQEIRKVKGKYADRAEEEQINLHKNHSVVNLALGIEHIGTEYSEIPVTIYKIRLPTVVTCWIGISTDTDPERIKNEAFHRASEDESIKTDRERIKEALRKAIEDEGIKSAAFEIVGTVDGANAARCVKQEIEEHKNWAVFNRQAPLQARESNKRRIEVFCEYFDVSYDEVLEKTQKFKDLMEKFKSLKDDIEKAKRQVSTGLFKPDKISDPILRAFAKRYESVKQEANAIDFLDMFIYSADLLEKNKDLLQDYQEKYRYVFVDEFQDISPVDFRLIDLFSDNLFAVGDDDQAIYGFRGGDSEIMQNFREKENVTEYKVTRNYRSSSTIVRHAKALIEHNPHRISKNLRAENSARSRVKVLKTSRDTVKGVLLNELFPIVTVCETPFKENAPNLENSLLRELTVPQQIGILARNWYEVSSIQTHLNSALKNNGFQVCWSDSDDKEKRKLIMRRGEKEIEISTIHSAKGREWEKVILLVNTMTNSRKPSLPDERNESEDERSLFYVAVTRAKQELIVLDGGNCEFVSEFQNVPLTKKDIEHAFREELVAQEPKLRKWLEEASKAALTRFQYRFKKELEKASDVARKQNEATLGRLRSNITQTENAIVQLGTKLQKDLRAANANLLEGLIPVLDKFGELINNPPETTELNNTAADCRTFVESVRLAQNQLRDSLESYGLKSIEVSAGEIFNPTHHEEISSAIYSDEISADRIAKEEQLGYLLHNRVVRKTRVIISKKKQIADILLSRDFSEPVRFVTYERFYDLRHIETFKNEVRGLDSRGREVQLQRFNVLFAFSKEDMAALKSHIQRRRPIANQDLQPIEFISERFHVADDILKPVLVKRDALEFDNQDSTVQFVTRSGHVLNGHLWNFDEDFLYMEINKKVVIVYRTGILQFKNLIWNEIAKAYKKGTPINGHITEHAKGGFRVKFGLLYGFLPKSEVESKTVRNLDSYLGKSFKMKVVKLSKSSNKIVLSRRAWLEETRTKLLNTLEVGQQVTGAVKNITTFGTFVDLGGIDGLIHKSEMAWKRIDHPSEIVSVGEEIKIKVIKFNRENEKISLSLKQMTSDPWENVEDKYPVGSTVRGVVVNIVNYGAFVQLEEGIDGLIHISEMPLDPNNAIPSAILNKNDEIEVIILKISKDSGRISLSIRSNLQNSF